MENSKETVPTKETVSSKKKKCKPRGGNSPVIGTNGYNLDSGDNAKFLSVNMKLFNTLWAITHDAPTGSTGYKTALPPGITDLIKKAYFLLENLWESYMNSGKVNPVAGIFLGKNNYGYQDKTEHVITPNQRNDSDYSVEEIRRRYIAPDSERLSEGNSEKSND